MWQGISLSAFALFAVPIDLLGAAAIVGFALGRRQGTGRALAACLFGVPLSLLLAVAAQLAAHFLFDSSDEVWLVLIILLPFQVVYVILVCRWIGAHPGRERLVSRQGAAC
jgi:hypothetical protein